MTCKPGFFNLDAENSEGCTSCFCYNKTEECSSAGGYSLERIPKDLFEWSEVNSGNFKTTSEKITFNLTTDPFILRTPSKYFGNRLYLRDKELTVEFSISFKDDVAGNRSVSVIFMGASDDQAMVTFSNITNDIIHKKLLTLNEEMTGVASWKLQLILINISSIRVVFTGVDGDIADFYNLEMFDVIDEVGGSFGGVEQCQCPQNFTGNSCNQCATGGALFLNKLNYFLKLQFYKS